MSCLLIALVISGCSHASKAPDVAKITSALESGGLVAGVASVQSSFTPNDDNQSVLKVSITASKGANPDKLADSVVGVVWKYVTAQVDVIDVNVLSTDKSVSFTVNRHYVLPDQESQLVSKYGPSGGG